MMITLTDNSHAFKAVSSGEVPWEPERLGQPLTEDHVIGKKLLDEIQSEKIKARYKIEIQFGAGRSISALKPSIGVLLMWESGKRFHGGGDQIMYWCGYKDCECPISTDYFANFSVACPACNRESFLDHDSKAYHVKEVKKSGGNVESFKRMPIVFSERYFRLPPVKLAGLIENTWRRLGCNADIYLKFHPTDIRYRTMMETAKDIDNMERARRLRGLSIYPLANILKDTAAGAEVRRRFLSFITA